MTAIRMSNARLLWTNFEGREGPYNNAGRRNFCVLITDPKVATEMADCGFAVNAMPKQLGWYLPVNIDTDDYEIEITDTQGIKRSESWWAGLDIFTLRGDVFISPRHWTAHVNGEKRQGVTAMLLAIDLKEQTEKENADATS